MVLPSDIIALAAVIGLVLIEIIPEKPQRIMWGIMLLILGLVPVIFMMNWIAIDIFSYPLTGFVAMFIAIVAGEMLFTEGLKEANIALKILSTVMGLIIIIVTSIPWLADFNAISFQLPPYSPVIDFSIYLIAGILTIIGGFKASA